ncbi:DUF3558 domain-containing protein [Actinophytocola glycyrrhizae]|uniref:DUF3558 domain-containing protein n=1 Tax=Actinophytocola glycyrrhizae TaxID=2044873 RepID=A0ABV9S4J4_9PSEU
MRVDVLRRARWLVVSVLLAGTACTTQADGTPTPGPTSAPSETTTKPSEDPADGAPRVADPLDATRFLTEPCTVLSQTQLATFDVSRPGIPTTTGAIAENVGPFCAWHAATELASLIGVGFLTGNESGLSDTYRGRDQFDYFIPTTVNGYPAVFADDPDQRDSGTCNITVGISDTLAISVSEQGLLDAQGSCDRAKQVAAAALTTLKEAG